MERHRPAALERIAPIAAEQDGFVTAAQAAQVGVDYARLVRLVDGDLLERVEHGVYRVTAGVPTIPRAPESLYIKYLALDGKRLPWTDRAAPQVVVSHESAADVLGIGTLPADIATFTSSKRRETTMSAAKIKVGPLDAADWAYLFDGRLPVTAAARTVVDLALAGAGRDYVERALSDALHERLTTRDEVMAMLDRRRRSARSARVGWLDQVLERS